MLEGTAEALNLPEGALQVSWDCLCNVGNLSSASVLLVLEEFMNRRRPAAGGYSILAATGPRFCSQLVYCAGDMRRPTTNRSSGRRRRLQLGRPVL